MAKSSFERREEFSEESMNGMRKRRKKDGPTNPKQRRRKGLHGEKYFLFPPASHLPSTNFHGHCSLVPCPLLIASTLSHPSRLLPAEYQLIGPYSIVMSALSSNIFDSPVVKALCKQVLETHTRQKAGNKKGNWLVDGETMWTSQSVNDTVEKWKKNKSIMGEEGQLFFAAQVLEYRKFVN
ncbi:hypothetical protein BT69DRAFT_1297312 [Atractiella rhizophila]|nr:hypothetical protein BT69DRAFT_1297312 [Atractiella rhizophila]